MADSSVQLTGSQPTQWASPITSTEAQYQPTSPYLTVQFGQATFDAEGVEAPSASFSRIIHHPGTPKSGVTIGRGYDMGGRTKAQVVKDLVAAGVPRGDAAILSEGAKLRGEKAAAFVKANKGSFPILSLAAQQRLFETVTAPVYVNDIKRIFDKATTVAQYGRVNWDTLPRNAQEFVFDLMYRGDYTAAVRKKLQPLLAQGDFAGVARLAADDAYWKKLGVPQARTDARKAIMSGAPQPPTPLPQGNSTSDILPPVVQEVQASPIEGFEAITSRGALPSYGVIPGSPTSDYQPKIQLGATRNNDGMTEADLKNYLVIALTVLQQVVVFLRALNDAYGDRLGRPAKEVK